MMQTITERLLSSNGRTNGAMAVLLTGAVTNMVLDPIMIFGFAGIPAMGISGAAVATVIGQCAAGTVGLMLNIKKNPNIEFHARSFIPDGGMIKEIMVLP